MPIAPRAPPTAMQGKCERGHSFSTPGLQFHGVDRADVYYNICVRASRCGKCALNPPTSRPIPHRRPSLAPAQRHALPEHSRSPAQRRCTPAGCAMHSPPSSQPVPAEGLRPPPHSDTPFPSISAPPRSADTRPPTARCIPRRPHNTFPPAPPRLPLRSASGTKKRHRTVHVRCRMSQSTVVAVGHLGW